MDSGKLEECLKGLLNSMITNERKEAQKLVEGALEKLKQSEIDVSNPEYFHIYLIHKLNKGIKAIADTIHDTPLKEVGDTYKPNFIYLHYDFLEHNIRELCILREGSCCCADKSRSILEIYLEYSLTNKIPEFDANKENYWIPKFGTYQEWINLCDGLYELYYGKTETYLRAYQTLIQTEIRRYKHVLHTWYIEFRDGENVKFDDTWDDKQENPLSNEYFDKGDYYVVHKRYVKNRNYEPYEDEGIKWNYCKVPKTDIEKVYKISEEIMR